MAQLPNNGAVIVSWDFKNGDKPLLLVGRDISGRLEVINAFIDDEARELRDKLATPSDALSEEGVG